MAQTEFQDRSDAGLLHRLSGEHDDAGAVVGMNEVENLLLDPLLRPVAEDRPNRRADVVGDAVGVELNDDVA